MPTRAHSAAVPYDWPYDGDLSPDRLALVICGAQRHWAAVCGERSDTTITNLARLAQLLGRAGGLVVALRHATRHVAAGSGGWELADGVGGDLVVDAAGLDGCYGSRLEHELRRAGRDHVVLGGLASELTVDSTIRTLNDRGFECLVLSDLCCPVSPELGERALHSVTMSGGIFGAVATSSAILEVLPCGK